MRVVEIIKLDAKGRVFLPIRMREAIGLKEGMYVMVIADLETRDIRVTAFADPEAKLIEFHIGLADVPGALAHVARVLAEANIDLLSTSSTTIRRGEHAEWVAIADASKCTLSLETLKENVLREGSAKTIEIKELS